MASTFCALLTAYLLAESAARSQWVLQRAPGLRVVILRATAATLLSYVFLGALHWPILLSVLAAGMAIATLARRGPLVSVAWFTFSHCLNLAVLLGLSALFPGAAAAGWWIRGLAPGLAQAYFALLSGISGLIVCVSVGGNLIAGIMRPFTDEIRGDDIAGLAQGGRYIGWLERILVLLLVLIEQPNGIGFLIAAKSILRFGEIKEPGQRKVAEYIIIGTFISFGWALFTSVLTQKAVKYWLP
ncbi:hypothetical protein [uncultured Paludibaculum sp.]|uniref:hypothetical protein n=1 Tax=uncultured Paludibaculum sp. TaxID=1765020 RepID=UPI002AABEEFA|nr:hypothetical protein [uncultured Paludibaculum sp.]